MLIFAYIVIGGKMMEIITKIEEFIWSTPLVLLLILTHIFFSIKLKWPQKYTFKGLKLMFKGNDKTQKGISSFKSLMTVLAATLGTGNIIGIAAAITIGGIGSIFWIFISGIFAIATKYAETYLVLKYRKSGEKGYYGGAMYVLRDVLNNKRLAKLFSIFVIAAAFGMGAMIQSNAMSISLQETFTTNKYFIAIIVTIVCSYMIFGDEKRISNISSVLVPIATIVYMIMCFYLLYMFRYNLIPSIIYIVKEAFSLEAVGGGIFGIVAIRAMNAGMSKGLFSNEAGMGSSPLFNATVNISNLKDESIIASTSVFIDTVFLCSITGLVFVASGMWNLSNETMSLVQNTFALIPYGKYLLTFSLAIFALATIPCWSYYGSIGIKFIFKDNKFAQKLYRYIYILCVYIGTVTALKFVLSMSSIANALMILPNLFMMYRLRNKIEK